MAVQARGCTSNISAYRPTLSNIEDEGSIQAIVAELDATHSNSGPDGRRLPAGIPWGSRSHSAIALARVLPKSYTSPRQLVASRRNPLTMLLSLERLTCVRHPDSAGSNLARGAHDIFLASLVLSALKHGLVESKSHLVGRLCYPDDVSDPGQPVGSSCGTIRLCQTCF